MMKQFGKTKWTGLLRCAFLTLLLVMMMAPTALGARRTVLVHNVREMMEALGDHRKSSWHRASTTCLPGCGDPLRTR